MKSALRSGGRVLRSERLCTAFNTKYRPLPTIGASWLHCTRNTPHALQFHDAPGSSKSALTAGVIACDGGGKSIQDILAKIEPLQPAIRDLDRECLTAVFLLTPSFATLAGDSHFLKNAVRKLFSAILRDSSTERDIHALVAVVDELPAQGAQRGRAHGRSYEPPPDGPVVQLGLKEGLAFLATAENSLSQVSQRSKGSTDEHTTSITMSVECAAAEKQSRGDIDEHHYTYRIELPLANTIFQTGKRCTAYSYIWHQTKGENHLVLADVTEGGHYGFRLPSSDTTKTQSIQAKLLLDLVALTKPRRIKSGMGNILRSLSMDGTADSGVPASQELEASVMAYFRASATAPQAASVWALIFPANLIKKYEKLLDDVFRNLAAQASDNNMSVIERAWSSHSPPWGQAILDMLESGAKLHRILSGGGGWGKRAGLLSLDPQTSFSDVPTEAGGHSEMVSSEEIKAIVDIANPGDFIQFFIQPPPRQSSSNDTNWTKTLIADSTFFASFGTSANPLLADTTTSGHEELDAEERDSKKAGVHLFKGKFGALSGNGISVSISTPSRNGVSHSVTRTKIDVPSSRVCFQYGSTRQLHLLPTFSRESSARGTESQGIYKSGGLNPSFASSPDDARLGQDRLRKSRDAASPEHKDHDRVLVRLYQSRARNTEMQAREVLIEDPKKGFEANWTIKKILTDPVRRVHELPRPTLKEMGHSTVAINKEDTVALRNQSSATHPTPGKPSMLKDLTRSPDQEYETHKPTMSDIESSASEISSPVVRMYVSRRPSVKPAEHENFTTHTPWKATPTNLTENDLGAVGSGQAQSLSPRKLDRVSAENDLKPVKTNTITVHAVRKHPSKRSAETDPKPVEGEIITLETFRKIPSRVPLQTSSKPIESEGNVHPCTLWTPVKISTEKRKPKTDEGRWTIVEHKAAASSKPKNIRKVKPDEGPWTTVQHEAVQIISSDADITPRLQFEGEIRFKKHAVGPPKQTNPSRSAVQQKATPPSLRTPLIKKHAVFDALDYKDAAAKLKSGLPLQMANPAWRSHGMFLIQKSVNRLIGLIYNIWVSGGFRIFQARRLIRYVRLQRWMRRRRGAQMQRWSRGQQFIRLHHRRRLQQGAKVVKVAKAAVTDTTATTADGAEVAEVAKGTEHTEGTKVAKSSERTKHGGRIKVTQHIEGTEDTEPQPVVRVYHSPRPTAIGRTIKTKEVGIEPEEQPPSQLRHSLLHFYRSRVKGRKRAEWRDLVSIYHSPQPERKINRRQPLDTDFGARFLGPDAPSPFDLQYQQLADLQSDLGPEALTFFDIERGQQLDSFATSGTMPPTKFDAPSLLEAETEQQLDPFATPGGERAAKPSRRARRAAQAREKGSQPQSQPQASPYRSEFPDMPTGAGWHWESQEDEDAALEAKDLASTIEALLKGF